ncbi:MraY family glycosyltransferase [Paludisphaera rhizosphaerae]|uniref:MraY family glycosyltransferase n=1 Tax=Paludisphaera rhizosphaerae TaxID=2711216 RepID=UPI0013EDD822|nr:MraY family glycosyltransferase [Paludisphaera rhizosphaerae]
MMISNGYLMIFAFAMMGCVLATPLVTQFAGLVGAIDKPDGYRRIHTSSVPRLGGLGLALGIAVGVLLPHASAWSPNFSINLPDLSYERPIVLAALIILLVGFIDDTRSLGPRVKLLGQAAAVMALYLGGIRIERIDALGLDLNLASPALHLEFLGRSLDLAPASLLVTLFWFLGCMNVWNLIDGMDGLASGVGLLVSGTLTLVALHNQNVEVAILATALAGSLAGFLLYNWHPACIFLGDSGALLIGLLIGVIGVQGSLKGPSAISILFPILAMGLPISDTAMAIFRRWVRNLPMSAADRRHVHHILIGLGLNPRQAALLLYCFSGFLCGAVLLGVSLRSEFLALVLGMSGCLAFLVVVTSRRDELNNLLDDFQARMVRGRQERQAAKTTWEAIQRVELCKSPLAAFEILEKTAETLGCAGIHVACADASFPPEGAVQTLDAIDDGTTASPGAIFRTVSGSLRITAVMRFADGALKADIVFRYLQRLTESLGDRLQGFAVEEAARRAEEAAAGSDPPDWRADAVEAKIPAPPAPFPIAMAKGLVRR